MMLGNLGISIGSAMSFAISPAGIIPAVGASSNTIDAFPWGSIPPDTYNHVGGISVTPGSSLTQIRGD
jgi:hypothetical protein